MVLLDVLFGPVILIFEVGLIILVVVVTLLIYFSMKALKNIRKDILNVNRDQEEGRWE